MKIKKYSAQAIQSRQIQEFNLWREAQQQSQPKTQENSTGFVGGKSVATPPSKPYTGPVPLTQLSVPLSNENVVIPDAPGYMAQDTVDVKTILGTNGSEDVFYAGKVRDGWAGTWDAAIGNPLKNWARRTWANINNPYDILPSPTPEQNLRIDMKIAEHKKATEADPFYDINRKVMEDAFGISMEETYKAAAVQDIAKEAGINTTSHEIVQSGKAAATTLIFGALGTFEWLGRNGAAIAKTLDETADEVAGADQGIQGAIDGVAKFERAVVESQYNYLSDAQKIEAEDKLRKDKAVLEFGKVLNAMSPAELFKDTGRLVLHLDKLKEGQFVKALNANLAGSQSIYSLMYDDAKNAEYMRRYEAGESPTKLAMQINNSVVELAGGIVFDPTTYLGLFTVKAAKNVGKEGLRIATETGIKSAARAAIDSAILDNRMMPEIKDAMSEVEKISKGTSVLTKDELVTKVADVYNATKKAFTEWKGARGITSLTSSAKQSLVIEQTKGFVGDLAARAADHPDGLDLFTGTLDNMIKMAEGGSFEAASGLMNNPLGQSMLSPQGIRTANLLADVKAGLPDLEKLIEAGDIKGIANAYSNAVESSIKKTILSVEEMRGAADDVERITKQIAEAGNDAKKVTALTEKLDSAKKMVEDYKKLPAHVKFFNGANELGKKTWLKPMAMFSQLYFGLNRFAYPARNILSTIPAMAYEFGARNALEMATTAMAGSQIESIGTKALSGMHDEIAKLIGYVPEAFKRSMTPIGEFVGKDQKILGLVRGGGEVAALSEQLMGGQIMLKTVQREMSNFLKYGGIPDVKVLGLATEDGAKLVEFAKYYEGDAAKTMNAFRQYMGGSVEAVRHISMPEKIGNFFQSLGGGNNLKKDIDALRETAQSADEFRAGMEAIWQKAEGIGEAARTVGTNLSEDIPASVVEDTQRALQFKYATPEAIDNFKRVVQGWRNSKTAMKETTIKLQNWFADSGLKMKNYEADMLALAKEPYAHQDNARKLILEVTENLKNGSSVEYAWNKLNTLDAAGYRIDKMTQVDPKKLSQPEMIRLVWDSYFRWSGEYWKDVAVNYNNSSISMLERMAKDLGTTLPDAAKMANAPYEETVKSFKSAVDLYDEYKLDSMIAIRKKIKGASLFDIDMDAMKAAGFRSRDHLFNTINKARVDAGAKAWTTHAQVEFYEIEDAFRRAKRAQGFIPESAEGDLIKGAYKQMQMPPIAGDQAVTQSRIIYDSLPNAKTDFTKYVDEVAGRWGETQAPIGALSDQHEKVLSDWVAELTKRTNQAKTEAGIAAAATRDAMLYDYRKQLWNVAAQYVSPFHYYHAQTVNAWFKNVAADPKWGAIYIDYKEYMAQRHAGLPDFWKQNIAVSGLPGYDRDNPLFFNIEASVNPLYQMIGQDFNDPNRRVDWLSSTVDDLSKVIPGLYQPLQWVVAASLYNKGQDDAARRWAGRLIPQTKIIKSVSNAANVNLPFSFANNEYDPIVGLLDNGLDPFEEKRALRYLATMPNISEEQRIDAGNTRSGQIWEEAVRQSLGARAGAEAMSYFAGVGYKPRTTTDIETDKFYEDYRKLISARSIMSADDYRDSWEAMRTKYPYMDALLIGKRAGEDRDTAFAYNVLSRVPPGETSDIAAFVRIEPYMLQSFYDNKGDMSKMLPQDRDRFMAAMTDLAAMMKMPEKATKQEWTQAKKTYSLMQNELKKAYGDDILDKINRFYELTDDQRKEYVSVFPQVSQAMSDQTAYVAGTPILAAYYGSIDTVSRYYNNKMNIELEKQYGKDIFDKVDHYYYLMDNDLTTEAKVFKAQNNLAVFFKQQEKLQQEANQYAVEAASNIPEGKDYAIRPDFRPQSGIQQGAKDYATTDQQAVYAQEIWAQLSPATQQYIQTYYDGTPLPYSVGKRLEYLGRRYNLSKQEVVRLLGLEVVQ